MHTVVGVALGAEPARLVGVGQLGAVGPLELVRVAGLPAAARLGAHHVDLVHVHLAILFKRQSSQLFVQLIEIGL